MVIRKIIRNPVPWTFYQTPFATTWTWETEHFIATIYQEGLGEQKMFSWKLNDKVAMNGTAVPFDGSATINFMQAQEAVLEVIAKAYNRSLGYHAFAGNLATTFQISGGRQMDFAGLIGNRVELEAYTGEGKETSTVIGVFDINHYDFSLKVDENDIVYVSPAYVIDIRDMNSGHTLLTAMQEAMEALARRVVDEEWKPGCTGRAGYREGTTEHRSGDLFCPIHQFV